ncbi:MAG: aminoacyl-tRNA hydrolase [Saprospiraceae bacterium]|nr:aminoacyl-tRNA hydrolase [Saprospiraceae bacterium]
MRRRSARSEAWSVKEICVRLRGESPVNGLLFTFTVMWKWLSRIFNTIQQTEEPDPMKYLIVGLGNMGAEYDNTRHNIGFAVIDHLAGEAEFEHESHGDLTKIKHKGRTLYLLKPSTYMNLSGKAVRYWVQKLKVQASNMLVIVDDINLDLGAIRLRGKGSHGGHNGLKDIEEKLQTNSYNRLRIGIGSEFGRGQQVDYVLGEWTDEERKELPDIIKASAAAVKDYTTMGLKRAMDVHNRKA